MSYRELGKHCAAAYRRAMTQPTTYGDCPLLTVGDRCEPLLGARRGPAREDEAGPNLAAMAPMLTVLT